MQATASAPGKCILMGEHSAVYGRPAIVAAVDRRLYVEIETSRFDGVHLDLPQLGLSINSTWSSVLDHARACRESWQVFERKPTPETFERFGSSDPANLVKIALGEAVERLDEDAPEGITFRLRSDIPIGAGFGSSAAMAVAIPLAYLSLRGARPARAELQELSFEIERRQHGTPSGVDNATVVHGGLLWTRRNHDKGLLVEPLAVRSPHLTRLRVFNTGTPAETTGAVVSAVRRRKEAESDRFDQRIEEMAVATSDLRAELESPRDRPACVIESIHRFERLLEELEVVPAPVRDLIRRVEAAGGAAKISGAGTLTGSAGGSLLVYHPDPSSISDWDFLDHLERLELRLGDDGARLETDDLSWLVPQPT